MPQNFFYREVHAKLMVQVTTPQEIEKESKRTIEALYGNSISNFKIREVFALPEFGPRVAWDVQVTFSLEGKKNTVDLEIQEKSGNVTNARLIDTMDPI
ncbi:MAG: hypothetical protein CXX67_09155 [Thaumarchaeota archaeon]|nr:MAG: hypothetical protein COB91_02200 [Nitrosopumilales archaeon]PXF25443.1 MAG: hypothetical protein CXX67_09155 [Nitrososphaerota archaeon]RTZ70670.1 MAG: hypothetical protein DSZ22_02110 [Nitrososphaerota archaeon]RZD35347.1 MAG: hypothetical protein CXT79_01445 [Nitrososphaerota archaeon]